MVNAQRELQGGMSSKAFTWLSLGAPVRLAGGK